LNARNGDIVSEYPMPSIEGENKVASFTIGNGGARIVLSTDNGDLRIKKGSAFPATPPPPASAAAPAAAPAAPGAPQLKTHKPLPPQPVTQ
jgi:hypothetical protein